MSKEKLPSEILYGALSDQDKDDMLELQDEFTAWKQARTELLKGIAEKMKDQDGQGTKK